MRGLRGERELERASDDRGRQRREEGGDGCVVCQHRCGINRRVIQVFRGHRLERGERRERVEREKHTGCILSS